MKEKLLAAPSAIEQCSRWVGALRLLTLLVCRKRFQIGLFHLSLLSCQPEKGIKNGASRN
jgi:hypothetical protein